MSTSTLTSQPQQLPIENQPSTASSPAPNTQPPASTPSRNYSQNLQINELQRGNPLLTCIRNVRWNYARNILADFEVSRSLGILYLSVKYHRLHPEYISKRISELGRSYQMRVLLVFVDFQDSKLALREINQAAVVGDMTLLLAWSLDEAGRYIETLKAYEHKQPDAIRERVEEGYVAKLNNTLTSIRSVNKTDALTLATNFKSVAGIAQASKEQLALCPGIGDLKAQRIFKAFNEPFI
ncbi:restriction endonuclease type II-like protein [Coemansia mojavensis]|nr:restriction endonuclease type II-like protein [Coemansia mojavensis]